MANPGLAVFKYEHDDRTVTQQNALGRIGGYLVAVVLFLLLTGPLVIFVIVAGAVGLFYTWPKKRLTLGPRYLLCGNTVVYYANVRKMVLRPGQALVLQTGDGELFTLDWERFPTNARKDAKIKKNKLAKFDKVARGIIRRVLHAAPNVECVGIDRE